ncbi:site-specific DNA-methyltransferase [Nocardia nova]|uniref:Methyltransferase n=1 Tax=Nocardia nova TaxID=37330 RepID=A0A2S6AHQ4_9NOCA|nr:site-specific DNA-methyltransferase [Nocardia nova]PPJ23146.1 site-specific DNA-methyltransferase [Nocardia nova]PPJ34756.1 site-specific DNA-methyltransferase [Nocardia nova]
MTLSRNSLLIGDATTRLRQMPDAAVDMVLTSPPYFRLRNYKATGQLGLESHVDEWTGRLLEVSRQVHRVLVPTGTYWLNLGDTYSTHRRQGAAYKSLLLAPERLLLGLQSDGWIVRNKIVWAKSNPIPSNTRDRLNTTYELVYVLAKQSSYFFDLDSIRTPHLSRPPKSPLTAVPHRGREWRGPNTDTTNGLAVVKQEGRVGHPLGKNPGDVWRLATSTFRGAHHATFPLSLADRAIQAGAPEQRCSVCRLPLRRRVIRQLGGRAVRSALAPSCHCDAVPEPGLVLDPFMGSGTTAVAAERLGRDWIGVELNPVFARLASKRIEAARTAASPIRPRAGPVEAAA